MYICTMSSKLHVGDNKAGIMKPPIARYHKKPGYDNGKYTNVYVRCIYTVHVIWYKYSFYMCIGHVHLCVFIAFNIASLTALRSGPLLYIRLSLGSPVYQVSCFVLYTWIRTQPAELPP